MMDGPGSKARRSAGPASSRLGSNLAPGTLLGRITAAVAAAALVLLGLGAWMINDRIARTVGALHAAELASVAAPLAERLARDGLAGAAAPGPALPDGIGYVILDAGGAWRGASVLVPAALPRPDLLGMAEVAFHLAQGGRPFWGISRRIDTPDGPVVLQIAQDMSTTFELLDDVPRALLAPVIALAAGIALLLVAAAFLSVRRLLTPLRRAAAEAEAIGSDPTRRLSLAGVPREVAPLIQTVNRTVERLAEALERQRAFSAEVAHELRTPLAILQAEVELLQDRALGARLAGDIAQLSRLVNQLLELAEAEGAAPDTSPFDLADLTAAMTARLSGMATRAGRGLRCERPEGPVWVSGSPEAIGRALRNLIENALAHTAPGTAVTVRALTPATIEVADHGPGIPPAQRALIFARFWRGDPARPGAGLGLAISRRIAEVHGGSLAVRDNPGGGAVFVLSLPAGRRAG